MSIDKGKVQTAVGLLLEGMGVPLDDHNFTETPKRFAKMLEEIFHPPQLEVPSFDEKYSDFIMMRGHVFYTMCPHHLLPVRIKASVAYYPNGKVIGASKLLRVCEDVNTYPRTQEALTDAILTRLEDMVEHTSQGAAVFMVGQHGCFSVRGVKSHEANMVTFRTSGVFKDRPELFTHFLSLAREA